MNILFLCVANSARSQIAEAIAKNVIPNNMIYSAGSQPGKEVHPAAIQVLKEIGITHLNQRPKSISELPHTFLKNLDLVVTLCEEEVCPVLPNSHAKVLRWSLLDPAKQAADHQLQTFREIRDVIREKLRDLKL